MNLVKFKNYLILDSIYVGGLWGGDWGGWLSGLMQLGSIEFDQQTLVEVSGAALYSLAHWHMELRPPRQRSLHGQLMVQKHEKS